MKALEDFVHRVETDNLKVEGILVYREGTEIFSHRWTPDRERNIYSNTKSFAATAVGIAIDDGILSLEDRLVDVFPDKVPRGGNPGLEKITLKSLLTMSSGFEKRLLFVEGRRSGEGFPDYVAYMMSQPVVQEPGSHFFYSTGDSCLFARMLEAKTGKNLAEYMYERVFRPMDIPYSMWECCPQGHPLGGSGLCLRLADMAKLGQLYLEGGKWKGNQIVSNAWVKEAVKKQIENPVFDENGKERKLPWDGHGYGYQFWLSEYPDSYRADGAYGQITMVLPRQQMVIAVQCPEEGHFSQVQRALHEMIVELV